MAKDKAKRLHVKSKDSAATPILSLRSPRFKHPTAKHHQPLPSLQSHLKSASARPKLSRSTNKPGLPRKKSRSPDACENVMEKDTLLAYLSVPRRSPRLAKIGTSGIKHDVDSALYKKDCLVTKLRLDEKACCQTICEVASHKGAISGAAKNPKRLLRSAKHGTTNMEPRMSARLVKKDTTSMIQDDISALKESNYSVTKLGIGEKTCPQSACEIASDKVTTMGTFKNQRRLLRYAEAGTTNKEQRRSPRLAKIGLTSTVQDENCAPKEIDCTVTSLGCEEKPSPQSVCEVASDKFAASGPVKNQRRLLRSTEAGTTNKEQRRSSRLAKIGLTSTVQDGNCAPKEIDCTVTSLGCEDKPSPQSVCEIASDKFAASGPVKKQRRLAKSAKVCTTNMPRRSPRLVSTDITGNNFSVEITKESTRSCKSNKSDSSGPAVHPTNVCNKATKSKCTKESSNNSSKGRRKSHRLTVPSDKLKEPNCSEGGEIGHISQQCQPSFCENASEKVAKLTSKPPLPPPNQRRSKRIGNQSDEITRKDSKFKYVEASDSDYESEKSPLGKKRKREESAETEAPDVFANEGLHDGLDGWTEEQERALHKAYLLARPTPHFWKKVSKMVPGKNAQECFNRIQSNFTTPPSIPPKTRLNKGCRIDSPLKKINLLDPSSPKDQISAEHKTRRVSKQKKTRDARKTLRHLLKKQKLVDQVQGADYFSQFESSPIVLPSDVKLPSDFSCKVGLNSGLENNLRQGPSQSQPEPSPVVLKQVKNMELHEKYIDHLHCVDARRKACVRACSNKGKDVDLGTQAGVVMDAKTALVSEAQDFIGCFKKLQADPFGDCALSEDDDEDVL